MTQEKQELQFGYYPHRFDKEIGDIVFSTLPDLDEKITGTSNCETVHKDWIYAPLNQTHNFSGEITTQPYTRRVFGLPKTHSITHKNPSDDKHEFFLIWCLGFLVGMRLTTTEAGFLDATPIKRGKLVDFHCMGEDLEAAIKYTDEFYVRHHGQPDIPKLIPSTVHCLFIAQGLQLLCYERLWYLYTALDSCWRIVEQTRNINRTTHAKRVECLCELLDIPLPSWAEFNSDEKNSAISKLRNATLHEGLFVGEPLGFEILKGFGDEEHSFGNPLMEVANFICRVLVAILEIPAKEYIKSQVGSRQIHGLDVVSFDADGGQT